MSSMGEVFKAARQHGVKIKTDTKGGTVKISYSNRLGNIKGFLNEIREYEVVSKGSQVINNYGKVGNQVFINHKKP